MKTKILSLATVALLIASCATKNPTVNEVKDIVLSPYQAEGKTLYENNCAKCHKLYATTDFNATEWVPILLTMQKKAKLQDGDREKIYAYVTKK